MSTPVSRQVICAHTHRQLKGCLFVKIDGRSVFGYFADRNDAEEAKERLIKAGFDDTALDSVSRFQGDGPDDHINPMTGGFGSLADLTLSADVEGDDTGILLAADPSASGFAADSTGLQEKAWLVVAVTDGSDQEVERAVKILKSYGADV